MEKRTSVIRLTFGGICIFATFLFFWVTFSEEEIIRIFEEIQRHTSPGAVAFLLAALIFSLVPIYIGSKFIQASKRFWIILIASSIIVAILATTVKVTRYKMYSNKILARLNFKDADSLILALQVDNYYVRSRVCEAISQLRSQNALEPLIKALSDGDFHTRRCAAKGLSEIGDMRAIEPLIVLLNNELNDKFNRRPKETRYIHEPAHSYVVRALAKLTGENFGDYHEKWKGWWDTNKKRFTLQQRKIPALSEIIFKGDDPDI